VEDVPSDQDIRPNPATTDTGMNKMSTSQLMSGFGAAQKQLKLPGNESYLIRTLHDEEKTAHDD